MMNIEKLAIENGFAISRPYIDEPYHYTGTIEQLEAFAKAYADNQEMYLLKVVADIRQAMGNADKLMMDELAPAIAKACALQSSEPVAEALHERNRLGYAVVDVICALDEIIENAQEVEVDDFLHIAIPIDLWHELQDALEEMPQRAELYTSPISKEWVGLSEETIDDIGNTLSDEQGFIPVETWTEFAEAIAAKLKQLNAPEKG